MRFDPALDYRQQGVLEICYSADPELIPSEVALEFPGIPFRQGFGYRSWSMLLISSASVSSLLREVSMVTFSKGSSRMAFVFLSKQRSSQT